MPTVINAVGAAATSAQMTLRLRHIVTLGCSLFLVSDLLCAPVFQTIPAMITILGCVASLWLISRECAASEILAAPVDVPILILCLGLGVALSVVGGQGHFFYATADWLIRDAVLADLSRAPMPVLYSYEGASWMLRAPLGMYLAPAAFGRFAGLATAHLMMLCQNAVLLGISLYLLTWVFARGKALFVLMFILFSGLDVVGFVLKHGLVNLPLHLEWWNPMFQYSSHVTQIFWAPNHALPAWWFAALVALHMRGAQCLATMIIMFAALLLWSPLAMMGALPFLVLAWATNPRALLTPRVLASCLTAAAFLPILLYLTSGANEVPRDLWFLAPGFASAYCLFIILEIPHALFVVWAPQLWRGQFRGLLALAIAVLLIVPFFRLGSANDFAMRASIVPLVLLACGFGAAIIEFASNRRWLALTLAGVIALVGAATPAVEITRNIVLRRFAISECDLVSSWREFAPELAISHYLARADQMPAWLTATSGNEQGRATKDSSCWPDHPTMQSPTKPVDNDSKTSYPER